MKKKTEDFLHRLSFIGAFNFAPVVSGVTLNSMSGNDSRSEQRGALTKKMKEEGADRNFYNQLRYVDLLFQIYSHFRMPKNDSLRWVERILYTLHAFCVLELGIKPI